MQKIVVTGGARLEGEVRISGAKNAVLPILCATLLADEPVRVTNVPRRHDVLTTAKPLAGLGAAPAGRLKLRHIKASIADHLEQDLSVNDLIFDMPERGWATRFAITKSPFSGPGRLSRKEVCLILSLSFGPKQARDGNF